MWGLKIQIKNNSYPVEVYRIMINEARHHLDVRLKPKSDYIQIRQGETKTILPGELCRQQIYTFDASIRIYLITPFEEAYEIRYIKLNSSYKCNGIHINNLFKFFVWCEVSKSFTRSII